MYKIFIDNKCICISNRRAYEAFCREFREVNAAGGLVVRRTEGGPVFLFIRRNGLWDLPKGHQEAGEDIRTTALREVCEETGLTAGDLRIHSGGPAPGATEKEGLIGITDHCYLRNGIWHLKHSWWYAMENSAAGRQGSPEVRHRLVPQTEEGISEAVWVRPDEIPALLENSYSSIREVIRQSEAGNGWE